MSEAAGDGLRHDDLHAFRVAIADRMTRPDERPFLCNGDPLRAKIFIVGFNPATNIERNFWHYWSDSSGMDYNMFMADYLAKRPLRGVRPRIGAMVASLGVGDCLETNIYSTATRRAPHLDVQDRRTEQFEFLFDEIRPRVVFAHSNGPIAYFERNCRVTLPDMTPITTRWRDHSFTLIGRHGPLWRAPLIEAKRIGVILADLVDSPAPSIRSSREPPFGVQRRGLPGH